MPVICLTAGVHIALESGRSASDEVVPIASLGVVQYCTTRTRPELGEVPGTVLPHNN